MASARTISPLGEDARLAAKRRSRKPEYQDAAGRLAQGIAIADLVILHRTRSRLTQQQLADRMGTSVTAISRLESGRHLPSMETLRLVGEALGKRVKVSFEKPAKKQRALAGALKTGHADTEAGAVKPLTNDLLRDIAARGRKRAQPGTRKAGGDSFALSKAHQP